MSLEEFKPDLLQHVIPFKSNSLVTPPVEHRLKLIERLGGGAYGEVYKAVEVSNDDGRPLQVDYGCSPSRTPTNKYYAVKYYMDETRTIMEDGIGCTTVRELSAVAGCGHHPNVVRMKYLFVEPLPRLAKAINQQRIEWAERQRRLVTSSQMESQLQSQLKNDELQPNQVFVFASYEFCEGGDVKKLLARYREEVGQSEGGVSPSWGLPLRDAKILIFQLLNGLAFLHNEKLCHRDLKPDNLFLTSTNLSDCVLKIGDLGLCRELRSNAGDITPTVCTIYYRPLEVLLGRIRTTTRSGCQDLGVHYGLGVDIWGAGCILAEMLRGIPLFKGTQEFEVLIRITKILGTPTEKEWTSCTSLQHYPFNNRAESHFFSEHDRRQNLNAVLYGKLDLDGLDLLARMLDYNPHTRISAAEALSHQWFTDVTFGKLDGLGVYNWYIDVLKYRLGEKTFMAMEKHTPDCLVTTKVSHILCQKNYNGAIVQRINRVFNDIGGFRDAEKLAYWRAVLSSERLSDRRTLAPAGKAVEIDDENSGCSKQNMRDEAMVPHRDISTQICAARPRSQFAAAMTGDNHITTVLFRDIPIAHVNPEPASVGSMFPTADNSLLGGLPLDPTTGVCHSEE